MFFAESARDEESPIDLRISDRTAFKIELLSTRSDLVNHRDEIHFLSNSGWAQDREVPLSAV